MVVEDYAAWEGKSPAFESHPPNISTLGVPMTWQEQKIGVLVIDVDVRRRTFDQTDIQLVTLFANVAAIAIKNVHLHNKLQERAEKLNQTLRHEVAQRTAELAHRALQLETSAKLSREITSILDIEELLKRVVELLHDAFGYNRVNISLVEPETNQLVLRASTDTSCLARSRDEPERALRAKELGSRIAASHRTVMLNDMETTPDAKSELTIPLQVGERLLGTLDIQSDKPNSFGEQDLLVIQSLGDQIAIAIENAQLYDHVRQLAVLEERNRLARDLHDVVTQTLFSASLIADVMPEMWMIDQDQGFELLKRLRHLNRGALAEMRTLLLELRPEVLVDASVGDLLRQLGETMTSRIGVPVAVTIEGKIEVPSDVQVGLYRIAQEALNNVARHAQARQVTVALRCSRGESQAGEHKEIELCVKDDGCGFDVEGTPKNHLGLAIMCERAEAIGAFMTIQSETGTGTEVTVHWQDEI